MVAYAILLQRVLRPSGNVLRPFLAKRRGGWLDRLKYVWYPVVVSIPLVMAVLAWLGFLYSAVQLEQRALDTMWLLLIVFVARATLLRILFLAQRRLEMEQRKKRRAAQAEAEAAKVTAAIPMTVQLAEGASGGAEVQAKSLPESSVVDVAAVGAQTRQLLNASVVFVLLIGIPLVWIEMLPALSFFEAT